jgi:hypothetical protein
MLSARLIYCLPALLLCASALAKNNVNGAVFRKNSVATQGQDQYTAYYDSVGYVTLAKRRLPAGAWQVQRTPYKGKVQDAHNVISLMVDGAGYLHLAFDHHGNPLHYCRSKAPGSLELSELLPMTGQQEGNGLTPSFTASLTATCSFCIAMAARVTATWP